MDRNKEKDVGRLIDNEPGAHFYWDDDVLGKKPSEGILGHLEGRDTILKEDLDGNPLVLFVDNREVCLLQTAAFYANRAGYSNIGDFLLHNLESDKVLEFLHDPKVRRVLKAEFDFISYNMRELAKENEDFHQESFDSYIREERQQLALIYAAGLVQFEEERSEALHQAYLSIRDQLPGQGFGTSVNNKVEIFKNDGLFGSWLYPKKGEHIH
jgi:hypothetical protein